MIEVSSATQTYRNGKGIFDVSFKVGEGTVTGYLGPNGAGKTTTIRALLGFTRPQRGSCRIAGLDCWREAAAIQHSLGYIPGEISFPDDMNADELLRFMREMRGKGGADRQGELLERFELEPRGPIRRFSKGMKQKLGIVIAFVHDPAVLILDEPTSGLDPLMQQRFVELIHDERARGKTILMSSHQFEEVERTCDSVLIVREGRIVEHADVATLKRAQRRLYRLQAAEPAAALSLLRGQGFEVAQVDERSLEVAVSHERIDQLIKTVAQLRLTDFESKAQTLEDIFMHYYGRQQGGA